MMEGNAGLQDGDEFSDEFVDDDRVGFALGGLHDRALQGVEGLFVAGLELGDGFGGGGQGEDFADQGFDFAGVVGLGEALGGDDGVGGLAGGQHIRKDGFLGLLLGEGAGVDQRHQFSDMLRRDAGGEAGEGESGRLVFGFQFSVFRGVTEAEVRGQLV